MLVGVDVRILRGEGPVQPSHDLARLDGQLLLLHVARFALVGQERQDEQLLRKLVERDGEEFLLRVGAILVVDAYLAEVAHDDAPRAN